MREGSRLRKVIFIRIADADRAELEKRAGQAGRPMSEVARAALRAGLKNEMAQPNETKR